MANTRESELHYPFGADVPAPGDTREVAPGVRWVHMALPFALDHVNLWLLRDHIDGVDGWSIVDCGITDEATMSAWEQVFAEHLDGLPVLRVICTHMHPDHVGLAHWLTRRWSVEGRECRLWMSATDWNAARMASSGPTSGVGGPSAADFFALHGMTDPGALDEVRRRSNYYASMVPEVPARFHRLQGGGRVTTGPAGARVEWTCIVGYGHAPEHIALHSAGAGVLISGDMVLPRISTNVSVIDIEPESNPLELYLQSVTAMRTLPADTLVLPSHGRPFTGLHRRIDQLVEHHDARYADVLVACAEAPRHAADLLPVLFRRKLDLHQSTFAMGESIAHLHALWYAGKLRREVGSDGVIRFATA